MADFRRIYLDHAATTPVREEVLEAILPYLKGIFGNPASLHYHGQQARKGLDEARERVAALIGAQRQEIIFTSGGTEGNNLAIRGAVEASGGAGAHVIASSIEHRAVLDLCDHLEASGVSVSRIPVNSEGRVDCAEVAEAIRGNTALVSVMMANNEIGTIQPIEQIGEICREKGVLFHTDAVQACGLIDVDAGRLPVDLLTLSAHKIYGPKGVGALYVRRGLKLEPQIFGGGQERGKRSGTENLPGIVGFGRAAELAKAERSGLAGRLGRLQERLMEGALGVEGARLNGGRFRRLPNNVNVCFEGVGGEDLLLSLDMKGISASGGSACQSGSLEPSHVLLALGLSEERASSAVRFTLGRGNTEGEVDRAVSALRESVEQIRGAGGKSRP